MGEGHKGQRLAAEIHISGPEVSKDLEVCLSGLKVCMLSLYHYPHQIHEIRRPT